MSMAPDDFAPPPSAPQGGVPAWMVIFGDALALLLTFFVMLFSMNAVQEEQWEAVVMTLSDRLNPGRPQVDRKGIEGRRQTKVYSPKAIDLGYLATLMNAKIASRPALAGVVVHRLDDRLVISLPGELLFAPGQATIKPQAMPVIEEIGQNLRLVINDVAVSGHTDETPPSKKRFISNWELSLARAAALARALKKTGYGPAITALGHADTHFGEIYPNLPLDVRYKMARRVDIIVRQEAGSGND